MNFQGATAEPLAPNADLVRLRHGTAGMADQMQIRRFCVRQHDRHRGYERAFATPGSTAVAGVQDNASRACPNGLTCARGGTAPGKEKSWQPSAALTTLQ